jgi:hypothetical protein
MFDLQDLMVRRADDGDWDLYRVRWTDENRRKVLGSNKRFEPFITQVVHLRTIRLLVAPHDDTSELELATFLARVTLASLYMNTALPSFRLSVLHCTGPNPVPITRDEVPHCTVSKPAPVPQSATTTSAVLSPILL